MRLYWFRNGSLGRQAAGTQRPGGAQRAGAHPQLCQDHGLWPRQASGHQRRRVQGSRRQDAYQVAGSRVYSAQDIHTQERRLGVR